MDCHLRCTLPMRRESAGTGLEGAGPGRFVEEPFLGDCLLPCSRLWGTGLLARCFVAELLARCSIRILSEPILPAALLTREVLLVSTLGPTRPCFLCSFLWSSAAMLVPSFLKRCKDYCIIAHMFQGSKWQAGCSQGFSNVALIGSKPPAPDESRPWCRLGVPAPNRHNALFLFFGAARGRGKKQFRKPAD